MITNFDNITHELTDEEKKLLPLIIKGFQTKTKSNPITGKEIVEAIMAKKQQLGIKSFSEPRLRKLTNYIRSNGILPLIATSNGYYVSNDIAEINAQIESLMDRSMAIRNSAEGLRKYIELNFK